MEFKGSKVSKGQWQKVLKALYYSAASGFSAGFALDLAGVLQSGETGTISALGTAALVGGLVAALNSLAVTIKQIFTPVE